MAAFTSVCHFVLFFLVVFIVVLSEQISLSREDSDKLLFISRSTLLHEHLVELKGSSRFNTFKLQRPNDNKPAKLAKAHQEVLRPMQGKMKTDVNGGLKQQTRITKHQKQVADFNIAHFNKLNEEKLKDGEIVTYNPGDKAPAFSLITLDGVLEFPNKELLNKSLMFHVYDPDVGFMDCLWNSFVALITPLSKLPNNTHVIFLSDVPLKDGFSTALWMKQQMVRGFQSMSSSVSFSDISSRLHFVVSPVKGLGNWIPSVLKEWMCVDHNCGYSQVVVQSPDISGAIVSERLDARYDWLPSPESIFPNKTAIALTDAGSGCLPSPAVNGSVAYVTSGGCSFFTKVAAMQKSGAIGVLVTSFVPGHLKDMNCEGEECSIPLRIPASMVLGTPSLIGDKKKTVYFQTTPSDNYHFAIDSEGRLAESGWWLYPSFKFLVWEAQWLNYKTELSGRLDEASLVVPVFSSQVMQGQAGVVANVTLPSMEKMRQYGKVELDMSLSCPGTRDTSCAHWDHTIQLFVCCLGRPPQFCELEIGRWISPFRRRVGRWLTDITPLLPLLDGPSCTFTMKTAPWALPWIPSLNLRFSQPKTQGVYPASVVPLYHPGATFDKKYNSNFQPIQFTVPQDTKKVLIYSVITGHGSDENGCGEFCVTSHHFNVNNITTNITFDNAGTPEGCADHVPAGVIPNEHGTWLYGRDGWCDGQQVDSWRIDITNHVTTNSYNRLQYYGWFNGTDPNPKENPGIIILWSYLVYYKPFS